MSDIFRKIAERKIEEAIEQGELDDLPLAGKPIRLDDLDGVPEELRSAFRVLKNANVLPEEVQLRQQMHELRNALEDSTDEEERRRLVRLLNEKEATYNLMLERIRRR
jgi:uncharacterized protein YutE (UPF0331/DUF86 family)